MLTRLFTLVTITLMEVLGVEGKLKLQVTLSNFMRCEHMKNGKVYIFVEDVHSAGRPGHAVLHNTLQTMCKCYSRSEQTSTTHDLTSERSAKLATFFHVTWRWNWNRIVLDIPSFISVKYTDVKSS